MLNVRFNISITTGKKVKNSDVKSDKKMRRRLLGSYRSDKFSSDLTWVSGVLLREYSTMFDLTGEQCFFGRPSRLI